MGFDKLTSEQRWDALVRHEKLDRVPCLQFILGHTAVVNGKPIAKIYDDAAASMACQRNAMEMYGYDGLILHGWANAGGFEFGGEIEYPYRRYTGAPMVKKNPVQSEQDAANLDVPRDIASAGSVPVALEFSRLQYKLGNAGYHPGRLPAYLGGLYLWRRAAHALADQEAGFGSPCSAQDNRLYPG